MPATAPKPPWRPWRQRRRSSSAGTATCPFPSSA
jgi:hypothetical protein